MTPDKYELRYGRSWCWTTNSWFSLIKPFGHCLAYCLSQCWLAMSRPILCGNMFDHEWPLIHCSLFRSGTSKGTWSRHCRGIPFQVLDPNIAEDLKKKGPRLSGLAALYGSWKIPIIFMDHDCDSGYPSGNLHIYVYIYIFHYIPIINHILTIY